jgi:hypothetical protein
MCLGTLDKKKTRRSGEGYKVMRGKYAGGYHCMMNDSHSPEVQRKVYYQGRLYEDDHVETLGCEHEKDENLNNIFPDNRPKSERTYLSGYHICESIYDVHELNRAFFESGNHWLYQAILVKVKFSEVVVTGDQYGAHVIVARKMQILHECKWDGRKA